jgi:predicted RNase H-like HicB family nuclease
MKIRPFEIYAFQVDQLSGRWLGEPCQDDSRLSGTGYNGCMSRRSLQHTIKAVIRPGEQAGYVAECMELPVVTQGATVDETLANLREAVGLHLDGENLADLGLVPQPSVVVTMELEPVRA